MLDFSNSKEKAANNFSFVGTGIHDFKVLVIAYQPVGDSVLGEQVKDGIKQYTKEQVVLSLECYATHAGKDSVGAKTVQGILEPQNQDQLDRLTSILGNMCSSANKEAVMKSITSWKLKSMEELAAKCQPLVGKNVRYKFTADKSGKYANLAGYFSGIAECADVEFSKSTITYNAAKEGTKEKPATSAFEQPTASDDLFGNSQLDGESLPF